MDACGINLTYLFQVRSDLTLVSSYFLLRPPIAEEFETVPPSGFVPNEVEVLPARLLQDIYTMME
jgi:hypothetical protein